MKDNVRITVIATGFGKPKRQPAGKNQAPAPQPQPQPQPPKPRTGEASAIELEKVFIREQRSDAQPYRPITEVISADEDLPDFLKNKNLLDD